jgi:FRG domain
MVSALHRPYCSQSSFSENATMSQIKLPSKYSGDVSNVSDWLGHINKWHDDLRMSDPDAHRRVWYRGHDQTTYALHPGVYRNNFTAVADKRKESDPELRRLNLERHLLAEFRTTGATLLDANKVVEVYFTAQHHGMPTRLLDWTTNPLAALFFAALQREDQDGDLFVMDASKLLVTPGTDMPWSVIELRHPFATDAIGESFWHDPKVKRKPIILPVRPDNRAGRVVQQSSCFTLHMHQSADQTNQTLARFHVPRNKKTEIIAELRRLNITEFSIYNDLDNLSKAIRRAKGV